ncbi:MAG: GNAT family N-acetyltransferase [Hyphomicrobium sp.]
MIGAGTKARVRRAVFADSEPLAQLFALSWRQAYGGIIPHKQLELIISRRGEAWWRRAIKTEAHLLVLEWDGKLAGYATCGAARRGGAYRGEIYELYLLPVYQGLGLGEVLFEACRGALDHRGLDGLMAWVLEDNHLAADFYYRRGGRAYSRETERLGTTPMVKIAYGWR